jgi:hypothetical protein
LPTAITLRATAFDPDLPPELDSVIARAMAKDPAQRYQRGLEFALDLRELRGRRQTISKSANCASRFPGAREVLARSLSEVTTHAPSLVPIGFFKMLGHAARQAPTFIRLQVLSWWRRPAGRIGLVFLMATIILGVSAKIIRQSCRSILSAREKRCAWQCDNRGKLNSDMNATIENAKERLAA